MTTYKLIAEKLDTKAYRAVGRALNANPYAPQVPCHRVVGSDGSLTGYAHGLKAKERILQREGLKIQQNKIENFEDVLFKF